jgi:gamma-glutamyltranspeptidase / glutathione hydrolase
MRTFIFIFLMQALASVLYAQPKSDTSTLGMVASAHPLATDAGYAVLRAGGNAFDAAAAVSFMLSVVEPSMSGIGGRLQAIWSRPGAGVAGIDATTQAAPGYIKKAGDPDDGYHTIGVPGMVKGITEMHTRYGKLPLKQVMQPAIEAAGKGHIISEEEARRQASVLKDLRGFTGSSRHFLVKDSTPAGGTIFRQPALAATLRDISRDGGKSFYTGGMAYTLAKEIADGGGFVKLADLENYKAPDAKVLRGNYRGYEIVGMGLPCYGAIVIEMLQMLGQTDLSSLDEATFLLKHSEVHYKAYEDRPLLRSREDSLVLPSWATKRWADTLPRALQVKAGAETNGNGHTTHFVVRDAEGNMVSITQSLGPVMGSKVASTKYGFMYATTTGPYLSGVKAGERAASHISPVILLKDGVPVMALGAAGGARIVPAIVQVISRIVDQGMAPEQALAAARIYRMEDRVLLEEHPGVYWKDEATPTAIRATGIRVERVRTRAQFGRVHLLLRLNDGSWIGAADPDWGGSAKGIDP